jgi:Holliday junction resolvase RusA-like endonuclease
MIELFLPIVPPTTTSQKKGVDFTSGRFYKKAAIQQAEADYLTLLRAHRPPQPIAGAIELSVCFVWPHLTGASQKRRVRDEWKTTRPDLDNSVKLLADCLTKLQFFYDDGQVARLIATKCHGPSAGVHISIVPIDNVPAAWMSRLPVTP